MIKTRTARRILAAATLTTIGFAGMADLAAAETPAQSGTIVLAPHTDPQGPIIVNPTPQPEPHPQPEPGPQADLPIANPEPEPQPPVDPDLPIANPEPEPQPPVDPDLPLGTPDPEPEVNPDLGDLPDDLEADLGCTFTHGCPEDEEQPTPDGHCFDEAGNVVDVADCMDETDDPEPKGGEEPETGDDAEVQGSSQDRGALPRTGTGLALLAGLGGALTAAGAAARKVARRS